jgi:hypothetical protein
MGDGNDLCASPHLGRRGGDDEDHQRDEDQPPSVAGVPDD